MESNDLRNWRSEDSHRIVRGVFLDFIEWLRSGHEETILTEDSPIPLFGHLQLDYTNLHVVAALLTQAQISHYEDNSTHKTRMPLHNDPAIGDEE